MEDVTRVAGSCPRCGKPIAPDAPQGICASCLLTAGTETLTGASVDDAPTVLSGWGDAAGNAQDDQRLGDGQVWGPYRIGRLLGRGGMGEVYEAEHLESGRRVALKVLRSRLQNRDERARFLREGQLAASISHPHTVYIFGSEEVAGMPVISMELLPGGTLKDRVVAHGPLAPAEAVGAVLDIIGGLDAAQAAGILHRDIKPSNCFVDADGSVKVGDFGLSISTLARDVRHELVTDSGGFQGTPQFAPPEQLRGEPLDLRADIYAVGATLYYLLTGRPPFDDRDLHDLFARVAREAPASPRAIRREIPPGLASVVLQCLNKAPSGRPASYGVLADLLRPFARADEQPARLGVRFVAGLVDTVILSLVVVVWTALTLDPISQAQGRYTPSDWAWALGVGYFIVVEGALHASFGKRLLGLRLSAPDGKLTVTRVAIRAASYYAPAILLFIVGAAFPDAMHALREPYIYKRVNVTFNGNIYDLIRFSLTVGLCLPARRRNGWAGVHDLVSGTRVVARSAMGERAWRTSVGEGAAVSPQPNALTGRRYGPFVVVSDAGETGGGRLFVAFDPVLRRLVWVLATPAGTPPVSVARRDVSRRGRVYWLAGRRTDQESWDAFEAPDGAAFSRPAPVTLDWSALKPWLIDLADELTAAQMDGTLQALGPERLWIRNDGRLVLLDFAAPGSVAPEGGCAPASLTPVGFLAAVAKQTTRASGGGPGGDPMPLSARSLLDRWSDAEPMPLDEAKTALLAVAAGPDRVSRGRRAISIGLAATPIAFLLVIGVLVMPGIFRFMGSQNAEMLRWLDILAEPVPPAGSRLSDPAIRAATERYVAGRYATALTNDQLWSGALAQSQLARLRPTAREIAARHPSVSPEELAQATAILAPELAKFSESDDSKGGGLRAGGATLVMTLLSIAAGFVLVCSLISSILVPGGVVTRLQGLAVVARSGIEIGRRRSLARTLVGWSPSIAWIVFLIMSPKIQGSAPASPAAIFAMSLGFGAQAIGALWTIARPTQGVHDWIAGTWVVPR